MGTEDEHGFGGLLRAHRLAAGLTQAVLAERSGISSRGIQDLERGLSQPRRDTLLRLEAALSLSRDEQAALHAAGQPTPRRHTSAFQPLHNRANTRVRYGHPGNLPLQLSSFVGRERESAELQELLARARLVTLTGPPGTGKTRLAIRMADQARGAFRDGVVFVALASVGDPDLVVAAVAQALGLQEQPGGPALDQLMDSLIGRELLLVLDNFEQVIAAGHHVAALLSVCPRLRVLVTSRELLRISGEHAYGVAPLDDVRRARTRRACGLRCDGRERGPRRGNLHPG